MAFRLDSADRLAWAVAIRAVLVAVYAYFILDLLWPHHYYVTAVFLGACAVGLCLGIARSLRRAQRELDQRPFDQVARVLAAGRAEWQQQLEYVQTLLDTVNAALVVVDPDGRVELVNRAARVLAGAPVTRLEEIKAVGTQAAGQLLELAPGTRKVLDLPDGRQMFISVAQLSSPLYGRRRMLSLHAIAGELDAVELKAWKDMAGVLAHEIMNSLTAISSLSESLGGMLQAQAGAVGAEVADALESIQRRSLGLLDFVERYRLIMDMPAPRLQPVSMDEFLAGIESLLGQGFRQKGIVFVRSVEPLPLTCHADPQLLEQALINLLKNSVEAVSDVPDPRIEVTCRVRDDVLVLDIADNGSGLVGAERGGLPVFSTRSGGSGIGLHLVRQIALSHGGRLEARKNQPRGSIFSLSLLKA